VTGEQLPDIADDQIGRRCALRVGAGGSIPYAANTRSGRGKAELLPPAPTPQRAAPADLIVAISGSCSPVTERQIRTVLRNGFAGIRLDPQETDRSSALCEALDIFGKAGACCSTARSDRME